MFDAGGRPPSLAALTISGKCPPFPCHSRPVTPFVANRVQSSSFYNSLPPHFFLPEPTPTNPKISLHIIVSLSDGCNTVIANATKPCAAPEIWRRTPYQ
ncbi:hypothetical protein ASPFODRAFT_43782 [Aspergillus luchuensis CBS 106.47]|uniref:Uncharacterized protein n=1 Tax=Aspergillus luchuensis (strain CBS 106.47) TaxID=1137211 RepID=A0A1M3TN90_ASPLC|nr:hypothetical protein ASPFODRAFT_43782 [Aspergillus luchuensis CBS 106.47]